MNLTNRERIMRILRGEPTDRPAVKLWGLEPGQRLLHPGYKPVYDLAVGCTDLFCGFVPSFDFIAGSASGRYETVSRKTSEEWTEKETILHTPVGDLSSVEYVSNCGKPGYHKTYFVKEPEDIGKLLSIPYEPYPVSLEAYHALDREIGDRGIVLFALDHPGYAMQRLMGSELLAILSIEERGLVAEAVSVFAARLGRHVKDAINAGLKDKGKKEGFVMAWVGPELLIPPLMSFKDFEEFCFGVDKPLIDMIHEAGGSAWIHSHGKMSKLIRRFADMGCDALNPVEPPPMGDITLEDAFAETGGRMALEGNIEIHEIIESNENRLKELIESAVATGAKHGRFILCPSTGYMEIPQPSPVMIDNLKTYVKFGLECAEKYHY